jgi:hypothetical protein
LPNRSDSAERHFCYQRAGLFARAHQVRDAGVFAEWRTPAGGGASNITEDVLFANFFQPVTDLYDSDNRQKAAEEIRRVRISIEVLRSYMRKLGAQHASVATDPQLAQAQAAYLKNRVCGAVGSPRHLV